MRSTTAIDRLPLHYENPEQTAELFGLDRTLKQQIFGISPRNLARLKRANGVLHPLVIARLKRFDRITQQAIDLFEDRQRAISWLQAPKVSLGGITLLAALSTDDGAKQVEEILDRTEYGIYA